MANGLWYLAEDNFVDADMSFLSAIPGAGDALGSGKTALKAGNRAADIVQEVGLDAIERMSASDMRRALKSASGKVKREIERFDPPKRGQGDNAKDHVHFSNGTSMNNDGTVHDKKGGVPAPSKETSEFLEKGGWAGGPVA